jgi:hypothetical protein
MQNISFKTFDDLENFLYEKLVHTNKETFVDFTYRSTDDVNLVVTTDTYIIIIDNYCLEIERNENASFVEYMIERLAHLANDNCYHLHIDDTDELFAIEIERQ